MGLFPQLKDNLKQDRKMNKIEERKFTQLKPTSLLLATTTTVAPPTTKKVVVIMGATGSGKSKLSIELATRFFPSEIINSDKIQVSKGLDITTNKISINERGGVVHHLLGEFSGPELFSPFDFRHTADNRITDIINRRKLPLIVGGSNPFIYALLSNQFNPGVDVFDELNPVQCESKELRHHFFFNPVLNRYLGKRFDETMYDVLKNEFSDQSTGLRVVEEVKGINENTKYLTEKQMWKIQRVEAMEAYRRRCRRETARFRRPKFGKDKLYYRT